MRHVIKLCLSGMMQAYSESRFIYTRATKSVPTDQAIIGIIAAAEGILREDTDALEKLNTQLWVEKVERNQEISYKMTDFQTVRPIENSKLSRLAGAEKEKPFLTASGGKKSMLPLFTKQYITNGDFTVLVAGEETAVLKAAEALKRPVFPLYLGRKCCPPNKPIFQELLTVN